MTRKRTSYTYDPRSVYTKVLLISSRYRKTVFVYCPPIGRKNPWVEEYETMDAAYPVAQRLAIRIGQQKVQITHDKIPWWLTGLTDEHKPPTFRVPVIASPDRDGAPG